MKALTISQPFASLIADGSKWVENRTWPTPYRGPLAIHAGKGKQYLTASQLREYPNGCIVAVVRLVQCVVLRGEPNERMRGVLIPGATTKRFGDLYDHEHTEGPVCWVLEDVRKLDTPIPFRGAQGLFNVPDELLARILDALPFPSPN